MKKKILDILLAVILASPMIINSIELSVLKSKLKLRGYNVTYVSNTGVFWFEDNQKHVTNKAGVRSLLSRS